MPRKKYLVTLTPEERGQLARLTSAGKASARTLTRARILLKADQADGGPAWEDARIAAALDRGLRTVERLRQRFVERGLGAALTHKEQQTPRRQRVLDGAAEARRLALACSPPPDGRAGWTLRLLADRLVGLQVVEAASRETVRRALKQTSRSRT
jgi:transposase